MNRGIVLVGGGGHCEAVIEALRASRRFTIRGIVDSNPEIKTVSGVPMIGGDECLAAIRKDICPHALITIGSVGHPTARRRLAELLRKLDFRCPAVVHPAACVARTAAVGEGAFVGKGAIVNAYARIGSHAIVNTGAIVEHHCSTGDFVHVAPGAVLCGGVFVGTNTHIGANATVIEGTRIGDNVLVGAGAVVVRDIPARRKAFGNPSTLRGWHVF